MTIEEILKVCPSLSQVTFNHIIDILGSDFNPEKTWKEMGFDDLDIIEMIMMIEKQLDFIFPDTLYDYVFGQDMKPINFKVVVRNRKLDDLGI